VKFISKKTSKKKIAEAENLIKKLSFDVVVISVIWYNL